jgi:hypothetical protein
MKLCFGEEGKQWPKGISEGALVGATTHRGAPGGMARPGGLCPPGASPSGNFCTNNSQKFKKNRIRFLGQSENFDFSATFYCTVKTENRQSMAFYFI